MKFYILIAILGGITMLLTLYFDVPSTVTSSNQIVTAKTQREFNDSFEATRKQLGMLTEQVSKSQQAFQRRIDTLEKTLQNLSKTADSETDSKLLGVEPLSREERLKRQAETKYRQRAEKTALLESEEVDYSWSSQAEEQIIHNFESDKQLDTREFDVMCRATHCSVTGEFGDPETRQQKINWLMTLIPWNTSSFYHGDDIEGTTGSLYVMRSKTIDQ